MKFRNLNFIILIVFLAMLPSRAFSQQDVDTTVKESLIRYLCNNIYSPVKEIPRESPIPIKVKMDKNKFIVWMANVDTEIISRNQISRFFDGIMVRGKAVIISSRGYNIAFPDLENFKKDRQSFETGDVNTVNITIPADCTPTFDPVTPQKERMLEVIVNSMQKELSWEYSHDKPSKALPRKVDLIVKNFNADDLGTLVLVEPSDGLYYTIILHDKSNYESDEYEQKGEYPCIMGDLRTLAKEYKAETRKYGIIKQVVVQP